MINSYTQNQICLLNQLRQLWEQHVYWTRFFIISTAENLSDLVPVTNRLLQNPKDFAKVFLPFYGIKKAERLQELLTNHLQIGGDLVTALKNSDIKKANNECLKWYKNADEIATFLSCINKYWNKEKWKCMLYNHLKMTENEARLRLHGRYEEDIEIFNKIENEALKMADYMFCGILRTCIM